MTEAQHHPAFDYNKALVHVQDDVALLDEVIALFFERLPGLLSEIREAVESRNCRGLECAAHELKGAVSIFGAKQVLYHAVKLEGMGLSNDFRDVQRHYSDLREQLSLLKEALTKCSSDHRGARPGAQPKEINSDLPGN
ncbi:MAG TPA: Hpt domain-containing protein [Candidatus Bathyarchaeia archaeon]